MLILGQSDCLNFDMGQSQRGRFRRSAKCLAKKSGPCKFRPKKIRKNPPGLASDTRLQDKNPPTNPDRLAEWRQPITYSKLKILIGCCISQSAVTQGSRIKKKSPKKSTLAGLEKSGQSDCRDFALRQSNRVNSRPMRRGQIE